MTNPKVADLAGPGIGNYHQLERVLPKDYSSLLTRRETQKAIFAVKRFIEDNLCKELNLMMVSVPLLVDIESGVNDMLDRDGSRTPIQFHISNDRDKHPIDAQIVQAATKWKRTALREFGMRLGEGLCTDMRAVRKDYFLDHDHSVYVDQWDWERVISADQRNLDFLKEIVNKIWKVLTEAERYAMELFPGASFEEVSQFTRKAHLSFMPKSCCTCIPICRASSARRPILQQCPALFITGIGYPLEDGYPTKCVPPITTTG